MKPGRGWAHDPALHLIAILTVILGAGLALSSPIGMSQRDQRIEHPPGCHACSACPREVAAARDAYLVRTGCIEPTVEGE